MVGLPEGYCIDSTEVTRGQYRAWLDTGPSTSTQTADCEWNTSFAPGAECFSLAYQGSGSDNHPQVCVDWCDAYAYCQAVGKRLCGKIGGGPSGFSYLENASSSQLYNACSSHAGYEYPYGNSRDARACNGADHAGNGGTTVAVGTLERCQSSEASYAGVYDLSGNVWEWEDSCDEAGESGHCRLRGGSFYTNDFILSCGYDTGMAVRSTAAVDAGLRCCS
jgi:formylglycine-generating enzyme required for sulfatase activity